MGVSNDSMKFHVGFQSPVDVLHSVLPLGSRRGRSSNGIVDQILEGTPLYSLAHH